LVEASTGADILRVTEDQKVAIGTGAAPAQKLHVQGNQYISGNLGIGTATPTHKLDVVGSTLGLKVSTTAATNNLIVSDISGSSFVGVRTNARASIFQPESLGVSGEVYISVRANIKNTSLVTTSGTTAVFASAQAGQDVRLATTSATDNIELKVGAVNVLFGQATTGNVGIGTATPTVKLDVVGTGDVFRVESDNGQAFIVGSSTTELQANSFNINSINSDCQVQINSTGLAANPTLDFTAGTFGNTLEIRGSNRPTFTSVNSGQMSFVGTVGHVFSNSSATTPTAMVHAKGINTLSSSNSFIAEDSAGATLLKVRNDGNVGIGTATPTQKLEVAGNTLVNGRIDVVGLDNSNSTIGFKAVNLANETIFQAANGHILKLANNKLQISKQTDNVLFTNLTATGDIQFDTAGGTVQALRIDGATGNVGIGTATPTEKLEVSGNIRTFAGQFVSGGNATVPQLNIAGNTSSVIKARIQGNITTAGTQRAFLVDANPTVATSDFRAIEGVAISPNATNNKGVFGSTRNGSSTSIGVEGLVNGGMSQASSNYTAAVRGRNSANLGATHYAGYFTNTSAITSSTIYGVYGSAIAAGDSQTRYGGYFAEFMVLLLRQEIAKHDMEVTLRQVEQERLRKTLAYMQLQRERQLTTLFNLLTEQKEQEKFLLLMRQVELLGKRQEAVLMAMVSIQVVVR
jgi:hypothetical protein